MQTRPYPERSGLRIWLSREERRALLDTVDVEDQQRALAMGLGLHGLRSDEIVDVAAEDLRPLANGADGHVLVIPEAKTPDGASGRREVPLSPSLARQLRSHRGAAGLRQDEPIVDVATRTLRSWMADAREQLLEDPQVDVDEAVLELGTHDLRRTWATDAYYSLALEGVPIAEQLVMSWGGWRQTSTGRETFRENYLGPVPDHVTAAAREHLPDLDVGP